MIDAKSLEQAKERLEEIINAERIATEDVKRKYIKEWYENILWKRNVPQETLDFFSKTDLSDSTVRKYLLSDTRLLFVRETCPLLIARGSHQIILDLSEGLVVKVSYRDLDRNGTFTIISDGFMQETRDILSSEGIPVQEVYACRIHWENNSTEEKIIISDGKDSSYGGLLRGRYHLPYKLFNQLREKQLVHLSNGYITSDLREEGRYQVIDYSDEIARTLINYDEIKKQYDVIYEKLMQFANNTKEDENNFLSGKIYLIRSGHGFKDGPENAIKKMFLLQIPVDLSREGKIVMGDLDHVRVFR